MTSPGVGDPAPPFALTNQHGQDVSPLGSEACLLVFYPFAFSGICTDELSGLRDRREEFRDAGVRLVGVSCDSVYVLRTFDDQRDLGFDLASDFWPHGAVSAAYGCFDAERGAAGRSSFLIDAAGIVRWTVHHGLGEARSAGLHAGALDQLL